MTSEAKSERQRREGGENYEEMHAVPETCVKIFNGYLIEQIVHGREILLSHEDRMKKKKNRNKDKDRMNEIKK